MNEQQAIDLVQKTFKSAFDRQGYIHFLKNLLNEFDGEGARSNQGARIPDKFQQHVEKLERVGKYQAEGGEVLLFIVWLKNESALERARTMQRNFIAHYLQMDLKDAALVAFVPPSRADWRFSFVKMEYRYDEEKNKIREEFTPVKRWSFLVGANEASHTAQRKLVPLMADDEHNPTLAELEEAFNTEKVTKEFFEKYRALFMRTKQALDQAVETGPAIKSDFEAKGVDTVNFAKKLLGQIVFLYYLQKKGWFGVGRDAAWGDGSRNFLRELFEKKHGDYKNFFNDILEPLFYDALRRDRSEDDHYYPAFKCKIPFLNGGLFDPMNNYDWVKTDVLLPNELFSTMSLPKGDAVRGRSPKQSPGDEGIASPRGLDTPDEHGLLDQRLATTSSFEEGDGILDIFDRYNFTVKEDEPFEKEVAIDPELLGKAYEKFNAIRPDNYDEFAQALKSGKKGEESKFNKQYGVYYTPREIVHYMCQQSLINYLFSEVSGSKFQVSGGDEGDNSIVEYSNIESSKIVYPTKEDIATLILKGGQIREHDERVINEGRETQDYPFLMPESIRQNASLLDLKLANIKVCDPAVGSGAFPVGMMNEIVRARDILRNYLTAKHAKSAKPVSSKDKTENQKENLSDLRGLGGSKSIYAFKRACIENSLYGVDIDPGAVEIAKLRLWLSLVVDEDDIQEIKPLPNLDYKIVCGNSLIGVEKNLFNAHLFSELEALKPLYFNATNITKKKEFKTKIDGLIEQITDGHKQFDFEIYFSEVFHEKGGFDLIVANPPYLFSAGREYRDYLNKNYSLVQYQTDYYVFFIEAALKQLHKKGVLSYIAPDSWLNSQNFSKLRNHLLSQHLILAIAVFDFLVFENVALENSILVLSAKDSPSEFPVVRFSSNEKYLIANRIKPSDAIERNMIDPQHSSDAAKLIKKIDQDSKALINLTKINRGIHAYRTDGYGKTKFGKGFQTKRDKETESYHSNRPLDKTYLPEIKGKDVFRYHFSVTGKYISYGDWLAEPREREYFYEPKLTVRKILGDRLHGTFIEQPYALDQSLYVIISKTSNLDELKFILGILLSGLGAWYLRTKYAIYDELYPWYTKSNLRISLSN